MRKIISACLFVLLAFAPVAHAGLITNGSFESPNYPGDAYATLGNGSTAIPGWTVVGSIDWIGNYWQASEGRLSIDLSGDFPGGVKLDSPFSTVIGQQYLLTFDLAGNPDAGPLVKTLNVTAGDRVDQPFTFDITGKSHGNMGWMQQHLLFTAVADHTDLIFASATNNAWGPALDNIDVTAVPEPASLLLLGTGLIGVGRAWRKRRS